MVLFYNLEAPYHEALSTPPSWAGIRIPIRRRRYCLPGVWHSLVGRRCWTDADAVVLADDNNVE
ncbi:MAG TPA: hypothetical protein VJS37_14755, partial [Terriglobales bacterium]|nr:hypothetical protein [Terriglobales bacterium]